MDNFLKFSTSDRQAFFTEAEARSGINATVLEKDFWVCWTLKQLFNNQELFDNMIFKGGTSLSKSYGLIDRFSEDCDLTINRLVLNVQNPSEPGISGKELHRRINTLRLRIKNYVKDFILPILSNACEKFINTDEKWQLDIDQDEQTILFSYPTTNNINNQYVQKIIRLELGARGGTSPKQNTTIKPYLTDSFPKLISEYDSLIPTLSAERTFWEKLTILHGFYHRRLNGKEIAERMSRHYYDVYMLITQGVDQSAMQDLDCLNDVVENNMIFFKDNNSSQNTAKLGSFRLVPTSEMQADLHKDYKNMDVMILGETPSFENIIKFITDLELKLNSYKL